MIGDKHDTEALDVNVLRDIGVVEEHSHLPRSGKATDRGVMTREYVDMSNDSRVKSPAAVNPRFPGQRFSSRG